METAEEVFEDREIAAPPGAASGARARRRRRRRVVTALGVCVLAVAASARAATFVVNSKTDATDGSCVPAPGGCTLREAIEAAVATAGRDTIRFDASVFPHGAVPVLIPLASALPVIADPAGTVIDGSGASVRIFGGGAIEDGLVFASAPGVPLTKPTVANVSVDSFTGDGVAICGGLPPTCDADVTGAVVRNVFVNGTGRSGITIAGRVVKKAQVIDSVTFQTSSDGIALFAGTLIGARVEGSTASRSGLDGISLSPPAIRPAWSSSTHPPRGSRKAQASASSRSATSPS